MGEAEVAESETDRRGPRSPHQSQLGHRYAAAHAFGEDREGEFTRQEGGQKVPNLQVLGLEVESVPR